jgi:hypothetical protein
VADGALGLGFWLPFRPDGAAADGRMPPAAGGRTRGVADGALGLGLGLGFRWINRQRPNRSQVAFPLERVGTVHIHEQETANPGALILCEKVIPNQGAIKTGWQSRPLRAGPTEGAGV